MRGILAFRAATVTQQALVPVAGVGIDGVPKSAFASFPPPSLPQNFVHIPKSL